MADVQLVLSEPLCFIISKLGKVASKSIKSVVLDYYMPDDISVAKVRLLDDISQLKTSEKIPYVPKRRDGDNKTARELDDIFTLIYFLDEHKLISSLPRYVTDNPDNMPTARLFEGDLSFILKKFELFDNRIDSVGSAISAILNEIRQVVPSAQVSLPEWPTLPTGRSAVNAANNNSAPTRTTTSRQRSTSSVVDNANRAGNGDQLIHDGSDWAAITSTPHNHRSGVGTSTSEVSEQDDADEPYTVVRSRKRLRQSTADARRQTPTTAAGAESIAAMNAARRRGPLIVGKAIDTDHRRLQAAKQLPEKKPVDRAVFYVDNVNMQHSDTDLRELVSKMGVRVLSVFEVRPRRLRSDTTPPTWKAFRLCILDRDRKAMLDPAKWPAHITVSEWYFKANTTNDRDDQQTNSAAVSTAPSAVSASTETECDRARSDVVSATDDDALAARGSSSHDTATVVNTDDTSTDQPLLPTDNGTGAVYEMECSDDTIIAIVDKSTILSTYVTDGCDC